MIKYVMAISAKGIAFLQEVIDLALWDPVSDW